MPEQFTEKLRALEDKLYACQYAQAVMSYDEATAAPARSEDGRARAAEMLSRISFDALVNPGTEALLKEAEAADLDELTAAEVRELRRRYDEIARIPADEYAAFTGLVQQAVPAWGRAKRSDDFDAFAPYLEKIVDARRRQAGYFAPDKDPYEAWLDRYERGLTIARCDAFFEALRAEILPLLKEIQTRGKPVRTDFLDRDWPLEGQRELARRIMDLWGLDPDHCVLAESEHPFTEGFWHGDVRITTHYMARDVLSSLYSVAHEGGHALYELHVDPACDFTVLGGGATMGLHESQSRLFENMVGRSRAFIHWLWPVLREIFPAQTADFTEEELYRAANRAEASLIRTEADELTYALHIMVRYELEKALLQGTLAVKDLPEAWNAKYKEYLGVDVPDNARGVLQDIHWAGGDMGYFPSYALGSAYAAQAWDDINAKLGDGVLEARMEQGDLAPLKDALCERLWKYGNSREPADLVRSLCGGEFDAKHYTAYLRRKYTDLYGL